MGDLPDFVSPVTGEVIHGRAGMRQHFKQHGLTNVADYKDEWAAKARERDSFYSGDTGYDSKRRKEAIIRALEKHRR